MRWLSHLVMMPPPKFSRHFPLGGGHGDHPGYAGKPVCLPVSLGKPWDPSEIAGRNRWGQGSLGSDFPTTLHSLT